MSLGDRLRQLRQEKGLTQAQLGAYFNLAESSISLYESGKRSPDYATLKRLVAFFAVTADYLLDYNDSAKLAREASPSYSPASYPMQLPVVTKISKDSGSFRYERSNAEEWYLGNSSISDSLYWFQVAGDTLSGDGILPGDLALIEEPAQLVHGQVGLVYLAEEGSLLCRLFQQDNSLILQCSNPLYPPRIYTGKEVNKVNIIGTVKEIRRKY